jgi:hypothetical protein
LVVRAILRGEPYGCINRRLYPLLYHYSVFIFWLGVGCSLNSALIPGDGGGVNVAWTRVLWTKKAAATCVVIVATVAAAPFPAVLIIRHRCSWACHVEQCRARPGSGLFSPQAEGRTLNAAVDVVGVGLCQALPLPAITVSSVSARQKNCVKKGQGRGKTRSVLLTMLSWASLIVHSQRRL